MTYQIDSSLTVDPEALTAVETVRLVRDGSKTARSMVEARLSRIDAIDGLLNGFLTVSTDRALEAADRIDEAVAAGRDPGPLAGVTVALKDNICTRGVRTTCGSHILKNFVPPYNATVVEKLESAGAIIIGKTNCDEFAMGSSTENSAYGTSRNPWDTNRVPGGSSGGSAVAVASHESCLSLGSDTGGSIRQPASLCGVIGMKPSYGRVSRYGLVAFASSLDQIGPFSRTVEDCALMLETLAGHDPLDSTSVKGVSTDFRTGLKEGVAGLRIGVPKEYFNGANDKVAACIRSAIDKLCRLGAIAEECSLPTTELGLAAYYIIAPAEASSNLARYDGVKYGHRAAQLNVHLGLTEQSRNEGFGAEVKQRIVVGTYVLSAGYYDAYYKKAQQVRTLIRQDFERVFQQFDVLITPTSPDVAFQIGAHSTDPLAMKMLDVCTIPVNLAGLPGLSILCGFVAGLPVGLQIIGKAFDEATVLRTAFAYENA